MKRAKSLQMNLHFRSLFVNNWLNQRLSNIAVNQSEENNQQTWMQLNTHHLMHENVIFCHRIIFMKEFDLNKRWLLFCIL